MEVDFILYGDRGIRALEIKRTGKVNSQMLRGLKAFLADYPLAKAYFIYGGERRLHEGNIEIVPVDEFMKNIGQIL